MAHMAGLYLHDNRGKDKDDAHNKHQHVAGEHYSDSYSWTKPWNQISISAPCWGPPLLSANDNREGVVVLRLPVVLSGTLTDAIYFDPPDSVLQ